MNVDRGPLCLARIEVEKEWRNDRYVIYPLAVEFCASPI